jgi:fluoride ion exporter CrcB/FEX
LRARTVGAALGVVDGLWVLSGVFLGGLGRSACDLVVVQVVCNQDPAETLALEVAGGLLALLSVVSFLGPRRVYLGPAVLALAVGGLVLATTSFSDFVALTLGLDAATFVACVAAAVRETRVSEQSHPMNLPVFG